MSLYNKYRPKGLKTFFGNESLKDSFQAVLNKEKREDIPHSFLFSGPSGCGKTTLARIAAAKLGASEFDLEEIDITDFRGIDTVREIKSRMNLRPMGGESRVFILDEIHRATKDAQSGLLKITEEAPGHVYFMLCTTDPDLLVPTLRNRCVEFTVSSLSDDEIVALLTRIAAKEERELSETTAQKIAESSIGSARAAISILEKIIDVSPEKQAIELERAAAIEHEGIDLCRALLKKSSWKEVAQIIAGLKTDPESIRQQVLGYASAVLLRADNPKAFMVLECFKDSFFYSKRAGLIRAAYMLVTGV